MPNIFQKIRRSFAEFTKKMDEYQVELTFAEMGIRDVSTGAVEQIVYEEKRPETLLVIGDNGNFSQYVMDYALEMAERMSYNILALSTTDLACGALELFPDNKKKMCEDFEAMAQENSKIFARMAIETGVNFSHVVLFEDVNDAVETVSKEFGNISFVIDDQLENRVSKRDDKRPENRLFVYSVR